MFVGSVLVHRTTYQLSFSVVSQAISRLMIRCGACVAYLSRRHCWVWFPKVFAVSPSWRCREHTNWRLFSFRLGIALLALGNELSVELSDMEKFSTVT